MKLSWVMSLVMAAIVGGVDASPTGDMLAVRSGRNQPVEMGVWHADLNKARAYAEENGMPLVAVWSNGEDCSHCLVFEQMAMSPVFRQWMKKSGYVFYFGVRDDGPYGPTSDGQEGYHGTSFYWCRMKNGGYDPYASQNWPYVRIYWREKNGGLRVDTFATGAAIDGEYDAIPMPASRGCTDNPKKFVVKGDDGTYNPSARYFIDKMTNVGYGILRDYVYNPVPPYRGGMFDVADANVQPEAGLQVEKGSTLTKLRVPLKRTDAEVIAYDGENVLNVYYPNGDFKAIGISWAKNESFKEVEVPLEPGLLAGTSEFRLKLVNSEGARKDQIYVGVVDPVENSPKNPLWVGEKTAKNLDWGEWTMDIDAAKAKVKAHNADKVNTAKAYTLLLASGSLWCPDCENMEDYVTSSDEFKAWANGVEQKIACVAIDMPPTKSGETEAPCLLSWHKASGAFKDYFKASGAGWLSRHGVPLTGNGGVNAQAVLARNLNMVQKDTQHGGYLQPGQVRMGVPTFILLREDGSVAGRIARFAVTSEPLKKTGAARHVVQRLNELLAQDAEAGEEKNDTAATTETFIAARDKRGCAATLSFADAVDYYRIDANPGTDLTLSLTGKSAAKLILEVGRWNNGSFAALAGACQTNALNAGVSVRCELPHEACYVRVSYPVDAKGFPEDASFALENDGSTICPYVLKSDSVFTATETMTKQKITDGYPEVSMSLVSGAYYRLVGVDKSEFPVLDQAASDSAQGTLKPLYYDAAKDLYFAPLTVAAATLPLKSNEIGEFWFGLQRWVPGAVAFEHVAWTVKEGGSDASDDFEYAIKMRRIDGVSGTAKAKIYLDREKSHAMMDGSTFEWSHDGHEFVWAEGESDVQAAGLVVKANPYADGPQTLVFKLVASADSDAEVAKALAEFTLVIADDDAVEPGRLALLVANGARIPASRTIVAEGGSTLRLGVWRIENADGYVYGSLSLGGTTFGELVWPGRDSETRFAEVTLPAFVEGGANTATIVLSGVKGTKVDADRKYLTVRLVPAGSAAFADHSVAFAGTRNVEMMPWVTVPVKASSIDDIGTDEFEVEKLSGSMAPGLIADFGKNEEGTGWEIWFSGVPTRAGVFSAVYQLVKNGVPGDTLQVTVTVDDPAKPMREGEKAENPSLARTRTISDVMVVDVSEERLIGLLNVTIPPSGRLSARYRPLSGRSVSLMSSSWSSCDGGNYVAKLVGAAEDAACYEMQLTAKTDGSVEIDFTDPMCASVQACLVPSREWSASSPAADWKGYYVTSLPFNGPSAEPKAMACGDGYVTLRMTASMAVTSGKMTYAGLLPNGKPFSGMGVLDVRRMKVGFSDVDVAVLPMLNVSESDTIAGALAISPVPDAPRRVLSFTDVMPVWEHVEDVAEASHSQKLDVYGCLYDPEADFSACCQQAFETTTLTFFALPERMNAMADFFASGRAAAWDASGMDVYIWRKDNINKMRAQGTAEARGLTLNFNRLSGLVDGSFKLAFADGSTKTARYRGIVMPGWGDRCVGGCSDSEKTDRPFISGAAWFNDALKPEYGGAEVRRGCPFSVGTVAGK